jgi:hypothetical protein
MDVEGSVPEDEPEVPQSVEVLGMDEVQHENKPGPVGSLGSFFTSRNASSQSGVKVTKSESILSAPSFMVSRRENEVATMS